MAYFPVPNVYQPYIEHIRSPLIESDAVLLLIVEVIDYSLHYHNLPNWVPTWNLDYLRMNNAITYFNENFAVTVINPNTEGQAIQQANELGFDLIKWLELLNCEEARKCLEHFLCLIYNRNEPSLFEIFSFACYVSRMALQRNRNSLVNDVVWALLLTLRKIIPYAEYYRGLHFVANMYHPPIDNEPFDDDEGIEVLEIVDYNPRANNRSRNFTDTILLFVRETIDYYLSYHNFAGVIPSSHLPDLCGNELRYFNETLKRTITHNCLEDTTVQLARERGFNEETWLQIYRPLEARNFQMHYLGQVFSSNAGNVLRMLCFACYSSKIAKQNNRTSLIDAVIGAVADFLLRYFPYPQYYTFLTSLAVEYNTVHQNEHLQSDDEGILDVENGSANSDENNGNEPAEEMPDNEENEERNDVQSPLIENDAEERSEAQPSLMEDDINELDASERCRIDSSKNRWQIHGLEGKSGSDASEEDNRSCSSEENNEAYILEEESERRNLEESGRRNLEESGRRSLEEESGRRSLEEESGRRSLEEGSGMRNLE